MDVEAEADAEAADADAKRDLLWKQVRLPKFLYWYWKYSGISGFLSILALSGPRRSI
jgi:hypothetical protein